MDEVGGHASILRRGWSMYIANSEMYIWTMKLTVTDARGRMPEIIEQARTQAVFLERRGKVVGVVVSSEQYERMLEAMEETEDVLAFDDAMGEEGDNIPWEQVKADLGWV